MQKMSKSWFLFYNMEQLPSAQTISYYHVLMDILTASTFQISVHTNYQSIQTCLPAEMVVTLSTVHISTATLCTNVPKPIAYLGLICVTQNGIAPWEMINLVFV